MNDELISSAVSFLRDPNVASSPLNKKIEFLQSKGLNEQEIEQALKQANDPNPGASSHTNANNSANSVTQTYSQNSTMPPAPLDYYNVVPQVPERTWKDYFIMATATAGVTYGLYQVVSRYLIPSIVPPGQSRVDEDKEKMDEEFIKIDKVLEQMALEQKEVRDANEAKLKEIDVVIDNVNDFLAKYNKDKLKFDDDLRLMKLEVDNLQNAVEKNMKLTKENIADELRDISEELASLKNLIKARSGSASTSERKVAPVSSIPSASEILRRAKSNLNGSAPTEDSSKGKEPSKGTEPVKEPEAQSQSEKTGPETNSPQPEKEVKSTGQDGVFAAGIPDWQLKHKDAEEKRESAAQANSGIPAWQQAMDGDGVVNKSIENVGVPAWQLNATK